MYVFCPLRFYLKALPSLQTLAISFMKPLSKQKKILPKVELGHVFIAYANTDIDKAEKEEITEEIMYARKSNLLVAKQQQSEWISTEISVNTVVIK